MSQHYLRQLFAPESIAVFGASTTAGSVGTTLFANLVRGGYSGRLYAINPKYTRIDGHPCVADIRQIEDKVDLAVITTPRQTVADILHACGEKGVRAVIIISAGFGEQGVDGKALEQTVLEISRRYQMRILGPNCLGLIHPSLGMNATFSKNSARPGQLALVSQSGALCTAMLDWAEAREIGFSSIVSLGDTADIDFGDVLDYLAQDPETHSILLYVEGIRHARRFISGLRIAARLKPVTVLKAGRHEAGMRAAVTHTGAMVGGDDDVFDVVGPTVASQRKRQIGTDGQKGDFVALGAGFFVEPLGLQITDTGVNRRHDANQHRLAGQGGTIEILEVLAEQHKCRSLITDLELGTD